jgi:hypothetical protein
MNVLQRLTALERQAATIVLTGTPIKPTGWTDGEHIAVVKGLGLIGANILVISDVFIDMYKTYIDKIQADYNAHGIMPEKPLIKANLPRCYDAFGGVRV